MTCYWWNHWFWITVFAVILAMPINSYPVSPLDENKDHNIKSLKSSAPSSLKLTTPAAALTNIDDVNMGNEPIPNTEPRRIEMVGEQDNVMTINNQKKNNTNFTNNNQKITGDEQQIEKSFITINHIHNNQSNSSLDSNNSSNNNSSFNSNNSNNSSLVRVIKFIPAERIEFDANKSKDLDRVEEPEDIIDTINDNNTRSMVSIKSSIQTRESEKPFDESTQSNIMQIEKKNSAANATTFQSALQVDVDSLESTTLTVVVDGKNEDEDDNGDDGSSDGASEKSHNDEIGSITKLNLVPTTPNSNFTQKIHGEEEATDKISTRLENVTKMNTDNGNINNNNTNSTNVTKNIEQERVRKSKELTSEYRDGSRSINFSSESKNLLTRSAAQDSQGFGGGGHHDDGNVSSEALQVQRAYLMDAGTISGICFAVFAICCGVTMAGVVFYRRRFLNKPQALSEPDSSGYIDDSTIRDNSDEMYSLDNDSFLNSLEAMTIQNYWTDTVKHTKL